jgi:ABC-2 type transport system ATP-binding protein
MNADQGGASSGTAVCTQNLRKEFDDMVAVRDVSFEVPEGSIFGFIGPSGSGKTTTIRMLTGRHAPTSGAVEVLGTPPSAFTQELQARIGYMPQHFALYPDLTIWENLSFAAAIYGMGFGRRKRLREVLGFVELMEHRGKPIHKISGGMQRRLSLAATLVHNPDLFFLDEPTTGIDPVLRKKFWERFKALKAAGKTLFITTQYVSEAAYCDRVGLLVEGRLLTVDSPEGLRQQAFGGGTLEVKTTVPVTEDRLSALQAADFAKHVSRVDQQHMRISVDDAGVAIPAVVKWLKDRGIDVATVEEYVPPFDDVFVKLIEDQQDAA